MFLDLGKRVVSIPHIETVEFDVDKAGRAQIKLFSGDAFSVTPEAASALRFVFDERLMPNIPILNLAFVMKNRAHIEQTLAAQRAQQGQTMPVPPTADNPAGEVPPLPGVENTTAVNLDKLGDIQELVSQLNAYVQGNKNRELPTMPSPTASAADPAPLPTTSKIIPIRPKESHE